MYDGALKTKVFCYIVNEYSLLRRPKLRKNRDVAYTQIIKISEGDILVDK